VGHLAELTPDNSEVNQQVLFKRVAIVHYGDAGTTTTAALADATQVSIFASFTRYRRKLSKP
jgi:hypothetical protein